MARRNLNYETIRPVGGINDFEGEAKPSELLEAKNVWAPHGDLITRPGFVGIASAAYSSMEDASTADDVVLLSEDVSEGTLSACLYGDSALSMSGLGDGDRWYIGVTDNTIDGTAIEHSTSEQQLSCGLSYWNGSSWVLLRGAEVSASASDPSLEKSSIHLQASPCIFNFVPPADWAQGTIEGHSRYWLRVELRDKHGVNTFGAGVELFNEDGKAPRLLKSVADIRALAVGEFPDAKRYVVARYMDEMSPPKIQYDNMASYSFDDSFSGHLDANTDATPASTTVVPQTGELYIAYGGTVSKHTTTKKLGQAGKVDVSVAIEPEGPLKESLGLHRHWDDGTDNFIQLDKFPPAYLMSFLSQRLFAVPVDRPHVIQWSQAFPMHNVWHPNAYEVTVEDDNSPITAIGSLQQNPVIFKQDSIWNMIDSGQDSADPRITRYTPSKVVGGIGCVAHASVKAVKSNLIFLAEDGIYAYGGTPNITKLSTKIDKTFQRINQSRIRFACAAHWRSHNLYLLSVPMDDSYHNNATLVYDYRNGSWWLWDGFVANYWVEDEAAYDLEQLYFANEKGHIFALSDGAYSDNGGEIESVITTHRLGKFDGYTRNVRLIEVGANTESDSINVSVLANDDDATKQQTDLSFKDINYAEFNKARFGKDKFDSKTMKRKRAAFRATGKWAQLSLKRKSSSKPMSVSLVDIGSKVIARR